MDQAVHAAQIHESAEVGQTANDALDTIFALLPGLLQASAFAGFVLCHDHRAAAADDALLLLVHLDDLQLQGLADELADLLHVAVGELRRRHERADAVHVVQIRPPLTTSLPTPSTYSPASYFSTSSAKALRFKMLR